jgi:predicted DCC family thiol-disulfide oxidoreductase YuxK
LANSQGYVKSETVLRIARALPRWHWTWVFQFIPRVIRDAIYDLVARNRRNCGTMAPDAGWLRPA